MYRNLKRAVATAIAGVLISACATTPSDVIAYPSEFCIVTDNKLGSMGDPIVKVYGNREIKFCCRPCVKEFEADKERFLAKLET